jgi:hypothetical protein
VEQLTETATALAPRHQAVAEPSVPSDAGFGRAIGTMQHQPPLSVFDGLVGQEVGPILRQLSEHNTHVLGGGGPLPRGRRPGFLGPVSFCFPEHRWEKERLTVTARGT